MLDTIVRMHCDEKKNILYRWLWRSDKDVGYAARIGYVTYYSEPGYRDE